MLQWWCNYWRRNKIKSRLILAVLWLWPCYNFKAFLLLVIRRHFLFFKEGTLEGSFYEILVSEFISCSWTSYSRILWTEHLKISRKCLLGKTVICDGRLLYRATHTLLAQSGSFKNKNMPYRRFHDVEGQAMLRD